MSVQVQQTTTDDEDENVEMPIKTVTSGVSPSDRMTDNAVKNILPARYLLRDDNGTTIEEADELFARVAENVAKAERKFTEKSTDEDFERWRDEFKYLMETLQFTPNSPTLMNAGAELQQLSACISGDTPIYTKDGLKTMASIEEGDEVLTHSGEFKPVISHWSNGVKETLDVKRGTSRGSNYSVTATPDHEFLTGGGDWKELSDIDSAKQPTASPDVEVPDSFDLTQYTAVMGKDKPVVSDGGVIRVENSDEPRTGTYDKQYSEIVASVENSDTFGYIAGAFLAEGDVDGSDVRFTIGSDENKFEQRIIEGLVELFDVHVAVSESSHGNWKTISASSPFIADLFLTQFGTGSAEKSLPEWMFAANNSYQQAVLDGILDGDEHESENGWELTLANPTLAYEASLLARNLGYDTNFTLEAENKLSANPTSRVRISKNSGKTYMDTISTQPSDECEVYDMEVAEDHSFVAGDFIVHNCFVLEVGDSMTQTAESGRPSIMETATNAAAIFKSGGGVGYSFSHLRPMGAVVGSTGGVSSGPLSFMEIYDTVCGTVEQGGKRRGAQMGIMRVDHPDIGRFVTAKRDEGRFSNFNISAGITDEFREAVVNDDDFTLYDPETEYEEAFEVVPETAQFYNYEYHDNPASAAEQKDGEVVKENLWRDYADTIRTTDGRTLREEWADEISLVEGEPMTLPARFIWDLIVDGAWHNGEPGLFYLDETNRQHSFDVGEHPEHKIRATNPCGEQPLCEFEACNLGHINLSLMVKDDAPSYDEYLEDRVLDFDKDIDPSEYPYEFVDEYMGKVLDRDRLDRVIEGGVRFLDNVVTMSEFPLDEIDDRVKGMRKIGLGVMGWAQMLFQLGIPYGSEESYAAGQYVMRYIDYRSKQESHKLARERGCFDYWEDSKYANPTEYPEWFRDHVYWDPDHWEDGYPIRNHNTTTVAPTGTTSMLANTSGGIEPVYNVAKFKNVGEDIQGNDFLVEFDDYFLQVLEANDYDVGHVKSVAEDLMRNNDFDGPHDLPIADEIADVFITTSDLTSEQHARMQRVFQEYVDSGISKTINLPNEAQRSDVADAYRLALSHDDVGAPPKGITVYRDGSRQEQVMTTRVDNKLDGDDEEACPKCEDGMLEDMAESNGESCAICDNCYYSPCA